MNNKDFSVNLKIRIYRWNVALVKYLRQLSKTSFRLDMSILDQLLRSGTSVGANYIEAIGASSKKEFRKFLSYSLKSGNESKFWLSLIADTGIDKKENIGYLLSDCIEITNILGKSVSTMYNTEKL